MQEIHRLKGSLDWNPGISLRNYIIFDCIMAKKKPKKTKKETSSIALIKQNCPRGPTKAQCCEDLSRSHNAQTTWASTKPEVGQFMVMGEIYYTLSSMSLLEWKSTCHHQPVNHEFVKLHRQDFQVWFPFCGNLLCPIKYLFSPQNTEDPHSQPHWEAYLLTELIINHCRENRGEQSKLSKGANYTVLKIITVYHVILTLFSVVPPEAFLTSHFALWFLYLTCTPSQHLRVIRAGILFPSSHRTWSQV